DWLDQVPLYRRRYYAVARLTDAGSWRDSVRDATSGFVSAFGLASRSVPTDEIEARQRQAASLERRLAPQVGVLRGTAGEVCWLYARALRRGADEPTFDERWEPQSEGPMGWGTEVRGRERPRGVLAHLTDVVVTDGGSAIDQDRPRHRRYVRIDDGDES